MTGRHLTAARAKWGDQIPDWIIALAQECDGIGIRAVAVKAGLSKTTVNEAVHNTYKARLDNVEQKVRGAFMGKTVQCPVLDDITVDLCLENQKRPFSAANPIRVALHRTCPTCPFNRTARPSKSTTSSKPEE